MKNGIRILLTIVLVHMLMLKGNSLTYTPEPKEDFPKKVSGILTHSCYDCHSTGSKTQKAVDAVDFKKWEEYKLTKKISLLTKIGEVVEKGEMPPEKHLSQYPDKALSESDVKTIRNWTKKESENLIK